MNIIIDYIGLQLLVVSPEEWQTLFMYSLLADSIQFQLNSILYSRLINMNIYVVDHRTNNCDLLQ